MSGLAIPVQPMAPPADLWTVHERFAAALSFPAFFSDYFSRHVAREIEEKHGRWSRLYMGPINFVFYTVLLPFTILVSIISLIALCVFAAMKVKAKGVLERESWSRAQRIATYVAFIGPTANILSLVIGSGHPSFPVVDRFFGGIPPDLKG